MAQDTKDHKTLNNSFDLIPDEIIVLIMSYFDEKDRFWMFGVLSKRFLALVNPKNLGT